MRVDRHESALGRREMAWADPDPRLRAFVRRYAGFLEFTLAPLRRRELPSGDVHCIISFGPPWELPDPDAPDLRSDRHLSFVAGLDDRHAFSEHAGLAYGAEIQFTPLGARAFFGMPTGELTHEVVALDAVSGRAGDRLVELLALAPDWTQRFALLDRAIATRVAEAPPPPREVAWAWSRLVATDGAVPVGGLAEDLGWSRKRLIGRFREHVGVAPKLYARLLRFQAAVETLRSARGEVDLAGLALDCGYYDQPHLNRDFRAFAGTTPTAFVAGRLPGQSGFVEETSIQDALPRAA
jgi:AraC-like DNA-binding protein